MPYYFAYGTSLLRSQMERRLMGNRPVTRAFLKGYRLAFMGNSVERRGPVANLLPDPGRMVPGTIYELNEVMIQYIDRAEACEKGIYQKLDVTVEKDGRKSGSRLLPPGPGSPPFRHAEFRLFPPGQAGLQGMGTPRGSVGGSPGLERGTGSRKRLN